MWIVFVCMGGVGVRLGMFMVYEKIYCIVIGYIVYIFFIFYLRFLKSKIME